MPEIDLGAETVVVDVLTEGEAMFRALQLAATPGVPFGPGPRAACVLLASDGAVVGEGYFRGADTVHAEIEALSMAGGAARGATAVVTLEPCSSGTDSCAEALIVAGVRRVVVAQRDSRLTGRSAGTLAAAGVEVEHGLMKEEAGEINRAWAFGLAHERPLVVWKFATTLDGRSAATDGTSRWVSSPAARIDTHRLRARCDTMLVGTQTVAVDNPQLTVRDERDQPLPDQPLRVVMGLRDLDPERRIFDGQAETLRLRTHDPSVALAEIFALGRRYVFLEGGPTLAAAFLRAGLVDEIVAYVAPMLLGGGLSAVADLGIRTIDEAFRPSVVDISTLGTVDSPKGEQPNVRIVMVTAKAVE